MKTPFSYGTFENNPLILNTSEIVLFYNISSSNMGGSISRSNLLAELERLATEVEGTPSQSDMQEHGKYSPGPYSREFGSWNSAIKEAGFQPNQQESISDEQLLSDLRDFAEELGTTPTAQQMTESGPHSRSRYSGRFRTWNDALKESGLEANQHKNLTDEALTEELRQFADRIDKAPSSMEMNQVGPRSSTTYVNRFGSWNSALEEAGLEPLHQVNNKCEIECDWCGEQMKRKPSATEGHNFCCSNCLNQWRSEITTEQNTIGREELLNEIAQLKENHGRPPSSSDMKQMGEFSVGAFQRTFGSWSNALEQAGFEDVSRDRMRNHGINEGDLIDELKRVANEVDRIPTRNDMTCNGEYSASPYVRTFGTWIDALEAAGFDISDRTPDRISENQLIEELKRLGKELGQTPRTRDMIEKGQFSINPYERAFGSWTNALHEAGYEANQRKEIPEEELISELQRVGDIVGRPPVNSDLMEYSEFSLRLYYNRFESLPGARRAAGFPANVGRPGQRISKRELLSEIGRVREKLGHPPSRDELTEHGKYSRAPYERVFGSISAAREAAGFSRELPSRQTIPDEDLLSEIDRLAEKLGRTPTIEALRKYGKYTHPTYRRAFGGWNEALREAGYEPNKLHQIDEEQIIAEIQRLKDVLERTPSVTDMDEFGNISATTAIQRFGSWDDAVSSAGLEPNSQPSGENHPLWKDGERTRRQYGPDWYQTREEIVERDGYRCATCGIEREEHQQEYGMDLHVHHRKPAKEFDERGDGDFEENLITLCASCHNFWENQPVQPEPRSDKSD